MKYLTPERSSIARCAAAPKRQVKSSRLPDQSASARAAARGIASVSMSSGCHTYSVQSAPSPPRTCGPVPGSNARTVSRETWPSCPGSIPRSPDCEKLK